MPLDLRFFSAARQIALAIIIAIAELMLQKHWLNGFLFLGWLLAWYTLGLLRQKWQLILGLVYFAALYFLFHYHFWCSFGIALTTTLFLLALYRATAAMPFNLRFLIMTMTAPISHGLGMLGAAAIGAIPAFPLSFVVLAGLICLVVGLFIHPAKNQ